MKKIYKAPTMLVTEINAEELICASPGYLSIDSDDKANKNGAVLVRERGSRSYSILDEIE